MNGRRILGGTTGLVLLGCSGVLGPDPAGIVALEQAIEQADPAVAADLLFQGSAEAGSVRFGCADAFGALAGFDPDQRAVVLASVFDDWTAFCPSTCADDLGALADLDPPKRIAATLAQCDRAGPDPVFGGELSALRASMPPMDYLAVRMLAEIAGDTSPTFESLYPKLAIALVMKGAPSEMVPTSELTVLASRTVDPAALADLQTAIRACGPDTVVAHRLVLDPNGRVDGIAAAGEPGSPCLDAALEGLVLPLADGGYTILDLAWKPEPLPRESGGARSKQPVIDGPLEREVIERIIRGNVGQVRYCYEKQLARGPSRAGDVVVRFVIAPSGRVSEAETVSNTVGSSELGRCIETMFEKWRFPPPSGPVTVTWPMHFVPS